MAEALRLVRAKRTPILIRSSTKDGGASNCLLSEPPAPQRKDGPDGLGEAQHPRALEKSINRADRRGAGKCKYEPSTALLKGVKHQHCRDCEQSKAMRRVHGSSIAKEDLRVLPKNRVHVPYTCSDGNPLDSERTTISTFTRRAMNSVPPLVGFLTKCALLCSMLLLLSNIQVASPSAHAWLSSLPLALAGAAYAVLQIRLRPGRWMLAKRLLLAASFMLWAIDQLLPSGRLAMFIGDAVVSAYVLDLFWIIQEQRENGIEESKTSAAVEFSEMRK
jgi:hypothetical protein